jgi:hypothetical protein
MSDTDDLLPDDPEEFKKFADDFESRREAFYQHVLDFMDQEEIDEAYMAHLLFDAAISMRMTAYGMGVENPSVAGLKIDLDRVAREVGEMLRETKKGAEEYIRTVKQERERAAAEGEGEAEGNEEEPE